MRKAFRLRRTTLIMVGCAALLVGIGAAKLNLHISIWLVGILFLLLLVSVRKMNIVSLVCVMFCGLTIGLLRGQIFIKNTNDYTELNNQRVVMTLIADSDGVYDERKQLSFDAKDMHVQVPYAVVLVGKMKIAGFGENSVLRGDRLKVSGKLFVTKGSRQASINYGQIELIKQGASVFDSIRRKFAAGLSNMLPEPLAPFGLGLLIGQRTSLPSDVALWLSAVGLTHIIAVSGYNLTIIVRFIHRVFGKRSRYQTVLFSAITIGCFLLITGFSASIVRATIVCALSLITWYYGRTIRPLLVLLLTASITAFWYPIYLWSDIGWYLSFLAFFGVLILAPLLSKRLFKKQPKPITQVVIESACAQIMTLPIILYIFNQSSIIALVTNVLVVPLLPFAMLVTLIAGIVGMAMPSMAIIALPARIVLTYILDVAHVFSKIPGIVMTAKISAVMMCAMYAGIALLSLMMWHKNTKDYDTITDENIYKMEPI